MAIMDTREQSAPYVDPPFDPQSALTDHDTSDTTARLSRTLDSVFRMNSDAENVPASQPNVDLDLGWLSDSIAEKCVKIAEDPLSSSRPLLYKQRNCLSRS